MQCDIIKMMSRQPLYDHIVDVEPFKLIVYGSAFTNETNS